MVLRKRFGHKKDQVTREWTRLGNEELYGLNSSPIKYKNPWGILFLTFLSTLCVLVWRIATLSLKQLLARL
jgi:hypothetical protein